MITDIIPINKWWGLCLFPFCVLYHFRPFFVLSTSLCSFHFSLSFWLKILGLWGLVTFLMQVVFKVLNRTTRRVVFSIVGRLHLAVSSLCHIVKYLVAFVVAFQLVILSLLKVCRSGRWAPVIPTLLCLTRANRPSSVYRLLFLWLLIFLRR